MIRVIEILKYKSKPVLMCELFDDDVVTDQLKTEIGMFQKSEFVIGESRGSFYPPNSKAILLQTDKDCSDIKSVEFV